MSRHVCVAISDRINVPVMVGIIRPAVLLPSAAVRWPVEQVRLILLHELLHVRRNDNFVTLVQRVVESVLWFHPAVLSVSRTIDQEREYCCDDLVLSMTGQCDIYAETLVRLAAANQIPVAAAFGRAPVFLRVRRILFQEELTMSRSLKWETAALLLGSLTCSLLLQGEAQSESPGDPVVVTEISKSSPTGTTEVPRIPGTVPDVSVATIPQGSGKTEKLEGRRRIRQTGKRPWGPEQVEGAPDTAGSGDLVTAWASRSTDDQAEWLLCEYESAVRVATVRVHETYNPGSLVKVTAFNADGEEVLAWEGEDPTPRDKLRGISVIPVDLEFPVSRIKLYFDSPSVPGWNEIDAVGIDDLDGEQHWARKVTASSTYAEPNVLIADGAMSNRSWGPEQAAGEPNTPGFGDAVTAWASASQDGQREWLICEYENPMMPDEIVVHENYAPGAVDRITALNDSDEETLLWEGIDPTDRSQPRGISVFPVTSDEPIKRIKIYLDSPAVPDWNEIDAVGLRKDEETQWAVKVEASSTYAAQSNFSPIPATTVMISADQLMELQEQVQQLTEQVAELKSQADDITALKDEIEALRKLLKAQLKVE